MFYVLTKPTWRCKGECYCSLHFARCVSRLQTLAPSSSCTEVSRVHFPETVNALILCTSRKFMWTYSAVERFCNIEEASQVLQNVILHHKCDMRTEGVAHVGSLSQTRMKHVVLFWHLIFLSRMSREVLVSGALAICIKLSYFRAVIILNRSKQRRSEFGVWQYL
jgi:hypothetical protein